MIVKPNNQPKVSQDLDAFLCWFSGTKKLTKGSKFILRHTTKEAQVIVSEIRYIKWMLTLFETGGCRRL